MSNSNVVIYSARDAMVDDAYQMLDRIHHKLVANAADIYVDLMKKRLRQGLAEREEMIHSAKYEDDVLAHRLLMAELREYDDLHQLPPLSLINYRHWVEERGPPRQQGGQSWIDQPRNIGLSILIALIAEKNTLEPTRNEASKGKIESGASILKRALKRKDRTMVLSEPRLNRVWGKYGEAAVLAIAAWRSWPELLPHLPLARLIRR